MSFPASPSASLVRDHSLPNHRGATVVQFTPVPSIQAALTTTPVLGEPTTALGALA